MTIQFIFIALFAVNLLLIWLAANKALSWHRLPGTFIFVLLPLFTALFDQPRFELDYFWWRIAGMFAIIFGIGLVSWTKFTLRKLIVRLGEPPRELCLSGPFQYVRHPLYLGLIFVFVGWWWAWAAVYAFYFGMLILVLVWIQGYLEEKVILEGKFGDRYREYRQKTGMFWVK